MSIYIARGNDTLGPYRPEEAAALIRRGLLSPKDLAARNGDAAWVPLSALLDAPSISTPAQSGLPMKSAARRSIRPAVFVLLAVLIGGEVAAVVFGGRRSRVSPVEKPGPASVHPHTAPAPSPAARPPVPGPAAAAPPTATPLPPPATPAKRDCRLDGILVLAKADGEAQRFPGVQVAAYSLEPLQPLLAEKEAHVQSQLALLQPQLEAAQAEKNARTAAADEASRTYLNASLTDPLRASLRFAAEQARADVGTAAADYRYLLGKRREIMDGGFYFQDLPTPTAEAQTDTEGAFTLALPAGGAYALAATVRRTGVKGTRTDYWLVKVVLEDGGRRSLTLSDANVASSGAAESLMQTAD